MVDFGGDEPIALPLGVWLRAAGLASALFLLLGAAGVWAALTMAARVLDDHAHAVATAQAAADPTAEAAARDAWLNASRGLASQLALAWGWAEPLEHVP